ncbi:hypothetical protein D3C80_839750 [compost metagenome]
MHVVVAEQRVFPAAEAVEGHGHRDGHVDADHADLDLVTEHARRVAIAREDGGAVGVLVGIDQGHRLLVALNPDHTKHGAKNLFLIDAHVSGDVVEQTATEVETVLVAGLLHAKVAAVYHQRCAFLDTNIDIAAYALQVLVADQWAHFGLRVATRADLQGTHSRCEAFDQRIGGRIAHRDSNGNRHAAFTRSAIGCAHQSVDRFVEVGVRHHHHMVFRAAQRLHALTVGRAGGVDIAGDGRGADEADRLHVRVRKDGVDGLLVTIDYVEYAVGQAGLGQQFGKQQRR